MFHQGRNYKNGDDFANEEGTSHRNKNRRSFKRTGRGGGHPPGLTGKQIGMYYRGKAKERRQKERKSIDKLKFVEIKFSLKQQIESFLETYDKCSVSSFNSRDRLLSNTNNYSLDNKMSDKEVIDSKFKKQYLRIISENIQDNLNKINIKDIRLERNKTLDSILLEDLMELQATDQYNNMLQFRKKLPAFKMQEEIVNLVEKNQVVVISGETGCGKTTQVAQFILNNEILKNNGSITNIICTQPRRISAITVAERIAAERSEKIGKSVGYHIRLEKKPPRVTGSILFCTTGMLLKYMENDPAIRSYSHIIIDEIHERSIESDFIIALLKVIVIKRPELKIILMSATLNSEKFSKFYNNCPCIHIPSFTYPVTEFYLEDVLQLTRFSFKTSKNNGCKRSMSEYDESSQMSGEFKDFMYPYIRNLRSQNAYPEYVLKEICKEDSENISIELIDELVHYICLNKDPGAILIFLTGISDISKLHKKMKFSKRYPGDKYLIYPIHSHMPTMDQKRIFSIPPFGVRKIIIATNIAETSITIEDVVYVIDCGKAKSSKFNLNANIDTLQSEWISIANAKQRRGRAGRVQPGICYHLYTKVRESMLDKFPIPEIMRSRLEEVILQIKILQLGKADEFLATLIDSPDTELVKLSIDLLKNINALDSNEILTPLGYHLAQLHVHPKIGKMLIWASLFSCVNPVFNIAASLAFKTPFYYSIENQNEADKMRKKLSMGKNSDHIILANAIATFEKHRDKSGRAANAFCENYFLSKNILIQLINMKKQFASCLHEMEFLCSFNPKDKDSNRNSDNIELIKAIICICLYPNIAEMNGKNYKAIFNTPEDGRVDIHPSSVNSHNCNNPNVYVTYFHKMRTNKLYLFDTTSISPYILLISTPKFLNYVSEENNVEIDVYNGLRIYSNIETLQIVQKLKEKMNEILSYKFSNPGIIRWNHEEGEVLRLVIMLICETQ